MRTNIIRTNLLWIGPALAALVAVAGCAPSPGDSGTGTQTTATETGTGTGGTETGGTETGGTGTAGTGGGGNSGGGNSGGGGTVDNGPWPVVINAGTVQLGTGKFCGGPSPLMVGKATVSVAHGPVTVKLLWRPAEGGNPYDLTTVEFTGTGAQSKDVATRLGGGSWGSSGTVRISYADLVPGPGQQASQYIPPTPLDISYQIPQCTKPDLSVKLVVSPVAQKCPYGQAMAYAVVTLGSELTRDTGGLTATLVLQHPTNGTTKAVEFGFVPGGPKAVTLPTVWTGLQAPRTYAANARVEVPRPGEPHHPHRYLAPEVKFTTTCVN